MDMILALGNLGDRSRKLSTQLESLRGNGGTAEQIEELERERGEVKNSIIRLSRSQAGYDRERYAALGRLPRHETNAGGNRQLSSVHGASAAQIEAAELYQAMV